MFDFTKVRDLSRKIVIEDDPAKIDLYLSRLHATVTREIENTRIVNPLSRVKPKARPSRQHE